MRTQPSEADLEHRLGALLEASGTLLQSLKLSDLLPAILGVAGRVVPAAAYAVWRSTPDGAEWRIVCASGLSEEYQRAVFPARRMQALPHLPLAVEDVDAEPLVAHRAAVYRREGVRALLAVPLTIEGKVAGTIAFYSREPHRYTQNEIRAASALANLAAAAIGRAEIDQRQAQSRAEAERARTRARFLAEAGTILASSLDYEVTLANATRLAVPRVCDWCIVHVVAEDGRLEEIAVSHADPAKVEWAREVTRRYPIAPDAPSGVPAVVRTGEPEIVTDISDDALVKSAQDEGHLRLLRQAGFTSYMCVPMIARNRTIGAITFITAESGRRFTVSDLQLAEELAGRAALAVDNARLYAGAQREAAALQRAMTALRHNEERLRLALEAGRMGIWDWNIATGKLDWTESLEPIHGLAPGAFDGRMESFVKLIDPDDRGGVDAAIARAVRERTPFETEFRVPFPDGSIHWVAGKGQVYYTDDGKPLRMIGLGMDITARKRLEEKMNQSQKLESIGLLAGGIAHDFNNLLTGVLGNASLALDVLPPGSEAVEMIENVVAASERAADLTRQLLAYSGQGRYLPAAVDLCSLVREMASLVHFSLPKMVTLKLEIGDGLPPVEADASQLQQVVMNLVINAAEAIGERPGTVLVRTAVVRVDDAYMRQFAVAGEIHSGDYVSLEVRDTGSGMDEDTLARIFDPFFTTKFTGRGLGLAAVSGIVRGHRGAINVWSRPGEGSSFEVLFPAAAVAAITAPEPPPAAIFQTSGTVLVVDDEETVRRTAEAALKRYGFSVLTAQDGREGVEVFARNADRIAAVVLDMTMPVMGGEEALRHIKRIRPEVPVIASSGYSEAETYRRFGSDALAGFIKKPYTAASIAASIRAVLPSGAEPARA